MKHECPRNGHFLRNVTFIFADDLDLGNSRCVLMRCAFIPNMSLVSKPFRSNGKMLSFHVKFVQTARRTDRRTTVKHYAPNLSIWGHKKVKLLKMRNFTFFHNVFYTICILKSFNSHISVVVCSIFEFGTISKSRTREWVKVPYPSIHHHISHPHHVRGWPWAHKWAHHRSHPRHGPSKEPLSTVLHHHTAHCTAGT